jgi:hypothetical protein
VTCYRVGIRLGEPRMPALLVAHRRPGFYFRVLEEGEVGAGDDIVRVAEGPERLSVAAADALLYLSGASEQDLARALRIPALSALRGSACAPRTMKPTHAGRLRVGPASCQRRRPRRNFTILRHAIDAANSTEKALIRA